MSSPAWVEWPLDAPIGVLSYRVERTDFAAQPWTAPVPAVADRAALRDVAEERAATSPNGERMLRRLHPMGVSASEPAGCKQIPARLTSTESEMARCRTGTRRYATFSSRARRERRQVAQRRSPGDEVVVP